MGLDPELPPENNPEEEGQGDGAQDAVPSESAIVPDSAPELSESEFQAASFVPTTKQGPVSADDIGAAMFVAYCESNGYLLAGPELGMRYANEIMPGLVQMLSSGFQATMKEMGMEEAEESEDGPAPMMPIDFNLLMAATDKDGGVHLLVTVEDEATGNYLLPVIEKDESGQTIFTLDGGSSSFQGLVSTFRELQSNEEGQRQFVLINRFICGNGIAATELSRLAELDFRSPFSTLLNIGMQQLELELDDVSAIQTASHPHLEGSMLSYFIEANDQRIFVGLGDPYGSGVVGLQYGLKFDEPLSGNSEELFPDSSRAELILSSYERTVQQSGHVMLKSDGVRSRYHVDRIKSGVESFLFDKASDIWGEDFEVKVLSPSIAPDGTIHLIAAIEEFIEVPLAQKSESEETGDSSSAHLRRLKCTRKKASSKSEETASTSETSDSERETERRLVYHLPWLDAREEMRSLQSDEFVGISIQTKLPDEIMPAATDIEPREGVDSAELVDHSIMSAFLTSAAMDREVKLLSHREARNLPEDEGGSTVMSVPSKAARSSIFFPTLRERVVEDLISKNLIEPVQAAAVQLRDIRVAHDKSVQLGAEYDFAFYFVAVEHDWGKHVVQFSRMNELGAVSFEDIASVHSFYPAETYRNFGSQPSPEMG